MFNAVNCNLYSKKKKTYVLGFLFSIILTIISFYTVMTHFFSSNVNYIIVILCAVMQILIHFIYFLDLNFSFKSRLNIMCLLFVMIIIFIITFGSIWIMFNLNNHMLGIHH